MKPPEGPNPERRSNNALLCFCIGAALAGASWLLGVGAAISAALSGGNPALLVAGAISTVALVLLAVAGFIMMAVGAVWLFVRVIADQREADGYRNIER